MQQCAGIDGYQLLINHGITDRNGTTPFGLESIQGDGTNEGSGSATESGGFIVGCKGTQMSRVAHRPRNSAKRVPVSSSFLKPVDSSGSCPSRHLSYAVADVRSCDHPTAQGHDEGLNISHKWHTFKDLCDFWVKDRFHILNTVPLRYLILLFVLAEAVWAAVLAVGLAVLTKGDVQGCLGGQVQHWMNYYFFTIETMFTIGFGQPRYPSCPVANVFPTVAVICTNVLNGLMVGLVFTKFSSSSARRWSIGFSPQICVAITCEHPAMVSECNSGLEADAEPNNTDTTPAVNCRRPVGELGKLYRHSYHQGDMFRSSFLGSEIDKQLDSECEVKGQEEGCHKLPTQLEDFDQQGIGFSLTFRLMNLSMARFFDPRLTLYIMRHDLHDLTISQVLRFHADIPLDFMELPIAVTVDSRDPDSALSDIALSELMKRGEMYELMAKLTFVDNSSSKTIELRKSWRLDDLLWGQAFTGIVKRRESWSYEILIDSLDATQALSDPLNVALAGAYKKTAQHVSVRIG